MSIQKKLPEMVESQGRLLGSSEHNWCLAVPGGTGITVLAILISKFPDPSLLENALRKLQNAHPILRSKLHSNTTTSTTRFSFITSPTPLDFKVKAFDLSSTLKILENVINPKGQSISPFQLILEHELNLQNTWLINHSSHSQNVFVVTTYALPSEKWVVVFRLLAAACDQPSAISLLRELLVLVGNEEGGGIQLEKENKGMISLGIEDLIPKGKAKKTLWQRGMDVLGYSMNSLTLTNLKFQDARSPRSSQVVRLHLNQDDTKRIIAGCKSRGIKLCGVLGAAGLIAAQSPKGHIDKQRKYGILTFINSRSLLEPPLSDHHFGFYQSVILNTHVMKGGEKLWELSKKVYVEFASYKNSNKHFTDMADINYLMCKVIENPGLTPSSSLRTSLLTVFEDTVVEYSNEKHKQIGLEDYMGCASIHGIGPSIAIFDTIRDGKLDCVCVYPSPLHSRDQIQEFVEEMKNVLVDGCNYA
ncbi:hypothetical protein P3X46_009506 [Hevea brasiliensis]|uniref:Uncharacterized protein n=1 Tax=Hevea brasiliensis TaxID=3981 RepID=A0ABQ9MM21_HEVBR|nr:uncharacterized protein LOC110653057 [Hevea brasiliensis]KAJ9181369.1 hypothetical protein P3X46_009506 [Hevea brasiliensis]